MSDSVVIAGIVVAGLVALVAVLCVSRVLTRHYDAKIATSKRMAAVRQRQYVVDRTESPEEPEGTSGGLDLAALAAPGGLDAAMDALGVPSAIRPAIGSFVEHAGGLSGVANILTKKLKPIVGGGWEF